MFHNLSVVFRSVNQIGGDVSCISLPTAGDFRIERQYSERHRFQHGDGKPLIITGKDNELPLAKYVPVLFTRQATVKANARVAHEPGFEQRALRSVSQELKPIIQARAFQFLNQSGKPIDAFLVPGKPSAVAQYDRAIPGWAPGIPQDPIWNTYRVGKHTDAVPVQLGEGPCCHRLQGRRDAQHSVKQPPLQWQLPVHSRPVRVKDSDATQRLVEIGAEGQAPEIVVERDVRTLFSHGLTKSPSEQRYCAARIEPQSVDARSGRRIPLEKEHKSRPDSQAFIVIEMPPQDGLHPTQTAKKCEQVRQIHARRELPDGRILQDYKPGGRAPEAERSTPVNSPTPRAKYLAWVVGQTYKFRVIANTFDSSLQLQKLVGLLLIGLFAVLVGFLLADSPITLILVVLGGGWLLLLPYHAKISVYLSIATFSSAFILPYFPGRPFLWEFAALLGWSGLIVTIFMRTYSKDFAVQIRREHWLFIGVAGYCGVLLVTMYYRGFGLRIFGGEQMGGRFYFQQISCAIFPVLFVVCRLSEKAVVRLFLLQCALGATYLISDFVLTYGPGRLYLLLQFFELPGDALNFESQADNFGLRRFQSLMTLSQGVFFLLLVFFNLKAFTSKQAVLLLPLIVAVIGVGLLSGHRYFLMIITFTVVVCVYAQRFLSVRNTLIVTGISVFLLTFTYAFSERMPLSAQRALSVLPGIQIDSHARMDGAGTLETRRLLRKIGTDLIPDYFWIGRGFGMSGGGDNSSIWDPTGLTRHINQGRFYNGFIGLMVNTGVFGTFFMMVFLGAGTSLAWRIIGILRVEGCEDTFTRTCSVLAGMWIATFLSFLFLHGDSEISLKIFSLQAGLLLVVHRLLLERVARRRLVVSES